MAASFVHYKMNNGNIYFLFLIIYFTFILDRLHFIVYNVNIR